MSLILPPTAASIQPSNPSPTTAARNNEQTQNDQGSFGEVLSRSLAPAGEVAEKTTSKAATDTPVKRQASDRKTDPEDLVNAMALLLLPPDSKVVPSAQGGGALATAGNTAVETTAPPLTELVVSTSVPTDGETAAQKVKPESTDTVAQPALAAASPKDAGQATLQTRLNAVSDNSAVALNPEKIEMQASAPDTGASDQSSKRDDKTANKPDNISADITGVIHGAAKVDAFPLAPRVEAAAMPVTITVSQAPTVDTLSASAALSINPMNAAALAPASMSTSTPPPPVTTLSLAPEVGSSEWGKALGQQLIQMDQRGHQVAELQLNPPGLGPLKVTLSMSDHQIQAMFVSAHLSVRAAVETALPQLRAALADNGISLGNTSVSSDGQQQAASAHSQNGQPDPRNNRSNRMADTEALAIRQVMAPLRQNNGITVDTYA